MHNETTLVEDLLISLLRDSSHKPTDGRVLVAGNRSGHLPLALVNAGAALTVHAFDFHHARAIGERLREAGIKDAQMVKCTPAVPDGPFARAYFMTTPRSMSAELVLDELEDIRSKLKVGGELFAAFEGEQSETLKTMKKVFAKVHVLSASCLSAFDEALGKKNLKAAHKAKALSRLSLFRVVKSEKDAAAKARVFAAEWPASVPGASTHTFTSLPGCFCHRRADLGGLALAEVATANLAGENKSALNILDMGCGCGLVGLLVADFLKGKAQTSLTLLDSHARAIAAAKINAARMRVNARFVLSDDGLEPSENGTYDVFLGNPPYFGDWRIAETFLATAKKVLAPGGVCLTVAKHEGGLNELQARYFGEVKVMHRRGYCVFVSRA